MILFNFQNAMEISYFTLNSQFLIISFFYVNRLTTQCLNDIVYIYVNLRLYVRQLQNKDEDETINLTTIDHSYRLSSSFLLSQLT